MSSRLATLVSSDTPRPAEYFDILYSSEREKSVDPDLKDDKISGESDAEKSSDANTNSDARGNGDSQVFSKGWQPNNDGGDKCDGDEDNVVFSKAAK